MSRRVPALRRLLFATVAAALAVGMSATAAQAAGDAPGSFRQAKTASVQDKWVPGALSSTTDVDVYRFTTKTTRHARVLLGDLAGNYRLRLLDARGRTVATSDRPGRENEEIYQRLEAGTYFAAVDAKQRTVSPKPYVVKFSSLAEGVLLLSKAEYGSGVTRELVFEVLNNTSRTVDYNGFHLRGAEKCPPQPSFQICTVFDRMAAQGRVLPPRARTSYFTADIQGQDTYTFTFLPGSPVAYSPKLSGTVTKSTPVAGGISFAGKITNKGTKPACRPMAVRSTYDGRGNLLSQREIWTWGRVAAGRSVTWSDAKAPLPPKGAVRTAWTFVELGPDKPC
jgi:hypothetical protein